MGRQEPEFFDNLRTRGLLSAEAGDHVVSGSVEFYSQQDPNVDGHNVSYNISLLGDGRCSEETSQHNYHISQSLTTHVDPISRVVTSVTVTFYNRETPIGCEIGVGLEGAILSGYEAVPNMDGPMGIDGPEEQTKSPLSKLAAEAIYSAGVDAFNRAVRGLGVVEEIGDVVLAKHYATKK